MRCDQWQVKAPRKTVGLYRLTSGRLEQELDLDRLIRKLDAPRGTAVENTGIEQSGHVAMNRLHVSSDAASCFANRDGACTTQGLQKFPAPSRQDLPQQFRGFKADPRRLLGMSGFPGTCEIIRGLLPRCQTTYSANPPSSSTTRRRNNSTAFMLAIVPTRVRQRQAPPEGQPGLR